MDIPSSQTTAPPALATQVCIQRIDQWHLDSVGSTHSPLSSIASALHRLRHEPPTRGRLHVVDDRSENPGIDTPVSLWPRWFSDQASQQQPVFYQTRSATSAQVSMLASQLGERGILLNDIESSPSRWAKGAHPWLPLWLAGNRDCLPYDPACGAEALAILGGAVQALYIEAQPVVCYMTLHDEPGESGACDRRQAWPGLYRLSSTAATSGTRIRLLGAGRMLREVRAAARLLEQDWGVACEVWSAPSYTRLAREAEAAQHWNRRHRDQTPRRSHLHDCLAASHAPVLAVTGYAGFVAAQIGAHLQAPFSALGADSLAPGQRLDRHWLVFSALQLLGREGPSDAERPEQARQRYRLF
ncbi:pyruvate dehydrogenase [Pseudomonas sp. Leaf127]|uniref:transketolase-like TK C-terminal-containing protein n=1 Tax=Pseudomonas sp. Leaf127 TaxID=1736267 RepID=UPI0007027553|nr:hypothetical protein [Pseudomonas sp. Leaf127]KQQ54479.1 pyruvate dehydrogenase [Pseudomonas sp. Leaf127]